MTGFCVLCLCVSLCVLFVFVLCVFMLVVANLAAILCALATALSASYVCESNRFPSIMCACCLW